MKTTFSALALATALICGNAMADIKAAKLAFDNAQMDTAKSLFLDNQDSVEAKTYLARIMLESDLDDAEDWIEKAVEQDDNNAEAHYYRGVVMSQQAQNSVFSAMSYAKKSKLSFARAVKLDPDNVDYLEGLFQFNIFAPSIAGGDMDEAKKLMETIAKLDPKTGIEAAIAYHMQDENEGEIESLLQQGKEAFPDLPDFFYRAGMYYQEQEKFEKAFTEFDAASGKSGEHEDSIEAKYLAIYQIGRTADFSETNVKQGIAAFTRYIDEAPEQGNMPGKDWAKFRMANLMVLAEQTADAKKIYQSLVKTEDEDLRKRAKKKLKRI